MGVLGSLAARLLEPLTLRRAESLARRYSPEQHARIRELGQAARRRALAAAELRDERDDRAALSLLREAARFAIAALLTARDAHAPQGDLSGPPAAAAAWTELTGLSDAAALGPLPRDFELARRVLGDGDELALERLSAREARDARIAGASALSWLLGQVETRSVRTLRVQRWLRLVGAVLLVSGAVAFTVVRALSPVNVALFKPVAASSLRPGSPPPARLTDGTVDRAYGAHTAVEERPWVRVDLLGRYRIARVVVVHRGDGYHDESLPLALELGTDDQSFRTVAQRTERFTDKQPWRAELGGATARYVRVRLERRGYLALNEIEVYGQKLAGP